MKTRRFQMFQIQRPHSTLTLSAEEHLSNLQVTCTLVPILHVSTKTQRLEPYPLCVLLEILLSYMCSCLCLCLCVTKLCVCVCVGAHVHLMHRKTQMARTWGRYPTIRVIYSRTICSPVVRSTQEKQEMNFAVTSPHQQEKRIEGRGREE